MTQEPNSEPETSERRSTRLHHHHHRGRKRYLYAGLLLLLALAAGCAIGVGATVIYFKNKRFTPPNPEEVADTILGHMDKAVSLTPDERTKLRSLILTRMEEIRRMRRESMDQLRGEFGRMSDDIDGILGPERAQKWDQDFKHRTGRDRHPPPRRDREHGGDSDREHGQQEHGRQRQDSRAPGK